MALRNNQTNIVHLLEATQAPLESCDQNRLEWYLEQHPAPAKTDPPSPPTVNKIIAPAPAWDQKWPWIPSYVPEKAQQGTLKDMDNSEIIRLLHSGALPVRWTHELAWERIARLTRQQRETSNRSLAFQDKMLDQLITFSERVESIETTLMEALEAELEKSKPKLSALTDTKSSRLKLALLLNCMGTHSQGIHLTLFHRRVKNAHQFVDQFGSDEVSLDILKDLLYCGEIMRDCKFPFTDHIEDCPVCINETADQLFNYLKEVGIALNADVLRENNINGRGVLFSLAKEFPNPASATLSLNRVRDIHEDVM